MCERLFAMGKVDTGFVGDLSYLLRGKRGFSRAVRAAMADTDQLFVVRCMDRDGALNLRKETRSKHLDWIIESQRAEFGGPLLDSTPAPIGSLLIVSGTSSEEVQEWAKADPYNQAGLFDSVTIRNWKMVQEPAQDLGKTVYAVICTDKEGVRELRAETRPKHLEWWHASARNGYIGPFPAPDGNGAVGSLIITDGEGVEEVKEWATGDPYNSVGLFQSVEIFAMAKVIYKKKLMI